MGSVIAALLREAYLRLSHQSKSASRAGSGEDLVGRWSGCRWRPHTAHPCTRVVEFPQNVTPDAQERPTRRAEWQLASVFEGCAHFRLNQDAAAGDDKPMDVEGFCCLLDRGQGLIAGQFPHQGEDDVGVGAVVVLLGLPDLHYLEAVGRRTPDVHQQTIDRRASPLDQLGLEATAVTALAELGAHDPRAAGAAIAACSEGLSCTGLPGTTMRIRGQLLISS